MKFVNSEACLHSKGKTIGGKDCQSRKYIERANSLNSAICDINERIEIAKVKLSEYCEVEYSSDSSSSSSSSSECFAKCKNEYSAIYIISVNDLDADAYALIELAEQEVCATIRKLIEFEKVNTYCFPSSSSSESVSSSSSSSSSSNYPDITSSSSSDFSSSEQDQSSSLSSSSSSSSSGASEECIYIASYCPCLHGMTIQLCPCEAPENYSNYYCGTSTVYEDCSTSSLSSSSSSSSGTPPSSSSSVSSSSSSSGVVGNQVTLGYNTLTSTWELSVDSMGIVATKLGGAATGVYEYQFGPCEGSSIFVV